MKKTTYILILLFIILVVGILVWSDKGANDVVLDEDTPAATSTEDSIEFTGEITELDYSKIAVDGPYRIEVMTARDEMRTVLVPSMGINLCLAQESIADLDALAVGDKIAARGSAGATAGSIVVCAATDHYLQEQ